MRTARQASVFAEKHVPLALYLARKWISNRHEAADVRQDAMLGLLEAARRFDPGRGIRFSTYLYHWIGCEVRLGRNRRFVVHVPQKAREAGRTVEIGPLEEYQEEDPARWRRLIESRTDLARALARLTDRERLALSLRYGEPGLTHREIGHRLGISRQAATDTHRRAIRKLRLFYREPSIQKDRSSLDSSRVSADEAPSRLARGFSA